jgi:hypothetical protein
VSAPLATITTHAFDLKTTPQSVFSRQKLCKVKVDARAILK